MESPYLTTELVKESKSSKAVIMNEGSYEETDYGTKLTLSVQIDAKSKIWRPNRDSVSNLSQAWGNESKEWIGKTADLKIMKVMGKDSIIASPL